MEMIHFVHRGNLFLEKATCDHQRKCSLRCFHCRLVFLGSPFGCSDHCFVQCTKGAYTYHTVNNTAGKDMAHSGTQLRLIFIAFCVGVLCLQIFLLLALGHSYFDTEIPHITPNWDFKDVHIITCIL